MGRLGASWDELPCTAPPTDVTSCGISLYGSASGVRNSCGFSLPLAATQHYNCVVIPGLQSDGLLSAGIHPATWDEFCQRYGWTEHRQRLLAGLKRALAILKAAGCKRVYIDGSFVTAKEVPKDFDGLWEVAGVNPGLLDPVLMNFSGKREAQKAKYLGELFPLIVNPVAASQALLEFFQTDKASGNPKGIIALDIEGTDL